MVTFVLVHGTGHGGWCWRFLSPLLRAQGHDVYAPTLTGLGATSHLLDKLDRIDLNTHIKDITNLLFYEDLSEVVLVGHSYGGMVITGVAAAKESKRLAHLIYLDAYLPLAGQNEIDLWPPEQKKKYEDDIASGINFRSPMPSSVLGITDPKISQWVQERLTPHRYSTYEDAAFVSGNEVENSSIPRTFIHCTAGPLSSWMEPFAKRARKFKWTVHTLPAGHDVMITNPQDLAEILLQVIEE